MVDDSSNEIRILMELLKNKFAVVAATSGEKPIAIVGGENPPDLVLMDVTMAPMNGYEACEKLHEIDENLPVIFVSANTQTDEILKGYDVGGVDYITKPIDEKVLLSKVNLVLSYSSRHQSLEDQKQQASDMVMVALSSAGKLSVVINFLRAGLKCKTHQQLAQTVIDSCAEYELEGCVQIRAGECFEASSHDVVTPLEHEVLTRSVNMNDRIVEKGARMIICFDSISILLKNIPTNDDVLKGELRDNLMIMAEDANNLVAKIGQEKSVNSTRSSMVADVLQESKQALDSFEVEQKAHKGKTIEIMDALIGGVEDSYFKLGLSDEQEQLISLILHKKIQ